MKKIHTQTLVVAGAKPRNPMVAPSLFRKAGAHRRPSRTERQQSQRALQRALKSLHPPSP